MSVADVDIRSGRERLLAAIGSADAFQYSGAIALFVIGSAGSLVTQVGIFESAQNFWASIVVAFVLNLVIALVVVSIYAFWLENRPSPSPWFMLPLAMGLGVFRIWLSHQLQDSVGIPSLLHSLQGYLAGAMHGLFWFVPMSLFFHNAARFDRERAKLLSELVDNRLRERRRTLLANALTEEMTRSVAAKVAASVSETRSTLASALTYADSTLALRDIAKGLRSTVDRDIRPMSRELWARTPPAETRLDWRTLLRLSCYEQPFPLFIIAVIMLGLGLPLSLSLPHPLSATLMDIVQIAFVLLYLWVVDRYFRTRDALGYWLAIAGTSVVVLLPALIVSSFGWTPADRDFWFTSAFFGVPLLIVFSCIVSGLEGTREAILERVRTLVDEAAVARELGTRELQFASQKLARHLHSSLQGRLMAISLELEQAAEQGRAAAMRDVLQRLDVLLEAPLVGAFEEGAVDVEAALDKLIAEWSAVADVSLEYQPNWSGQLEQGQLIVGIAEEAIANAVRHGHASRIQLQVVGSGTDVVVTIENDGLTQPIGAPGLGTRWLDQVSRTDWQLQPIDSGGMRLRVRLADVIPVEHS